MRALCDAYHGVVWPPLLFQSWTLLHLVRLWDFLSTSKKCPSTQSKANFKCSVLTRLKGGRQFLLWFWGWRLKGLHYPWRDCQEPMSRKMQLLCLVYVTAFLQTDLLLVYLFFCERKGSSGPVTQWRQLVSCDWSWHPHESLIPAKFVLKINQYKKTRWQKYSGLACSYT